MKTDKEKLRKVHTKNEIILAIGRNKGIATAICRDLDCTMYQLAGYLRIHSELKSLMDSAKQEIKSLAEEKLLENLNSENEAVKQKAVEFVLKTLGKAEYSTDPQVNVNVVSQKDINLQIQQLFT